MNPELMQMLMQQMATGRTDDVALQALMEKLMVGRDETEATGESPRALQIALQRQRRRVHRLTRQNEALTGLVRYFASMFGACSECLGHNPGCTACSGDGGPGFANPNADLLLAWTKPSLERLSMRIVAADGTARSAPEAQSQS